MHLLSAALRQPEETRVVRDHVLKIRFTFPMPDEVELHEENFTVRKKNLKARNSN
jgi:hypothetical protein